MPGASSGRSRLARHSERLALDPFVIGGGEVSPRDQRDLMERPFFSLAKGRRTAPILYEAGGQRIEVHATAQYGMATIWDADVLIWAAGHIVGAENLGFSTSRFLRFTPYQLLRGVGRATGNRQYVLLKAALQRLQSTVVATTIRQGEQWRRQQFSWINEWEELTTRDGRVEGMEFVLPEWFYRGVIDRSLVLAIDPAYFRLTGGIERWLYRVARKHAGRQAEGWIFELAHLHQKSGSLASSRDFAVDIRRIAARQSLPGYRLDLSRGHRCEYLQIRPENLSTVPVNNPVKPIGTSGADYIGTSGANRGRHFIEESNNKNNRWSLGPGQPAHGAVPPPANDWPTPSRDPYAQSSSRHSRPACSDADRAPELPLGLPEGAR